MVWQRVVRPGLLGQGTDEAVIESALPALRQQTGLLDQRLGEAEWLGGPALSLADLYLAPVMAYLSQTAEGRTALGEAPNLARWWKAISTRPSFRDTRPG